MGMLTEKDTTENTLVKSLKGKVCIKTRYSSIVARPWSLNLFETFFQQAAQRQESSTRKLHCPQSATVRVWGKKSG